VSFKPHENQQRIEEAATTFFKNRSHQSLNERYTSLAEETTQRNSELYPSAPSAPWAPSTIVRNRCPILNPANSETRTSQCSDRSLRPRAWRLRTVAPRRPNIYVKCGYAFVLSHLRCCKRCLHTGMGRRLKPPHLHMLSSTTPSDRLRSSQVSNSDDRIVVATVDMGYAPSLSRLLRAHIHQVSKAFSDLMEFGIIKASVKKEGLMRLSTNRISHSSFEEKHCMEPRIL